jgi:sarcosine oxidase subunit beta
MVAGTQPVPALPDGMPMVVDLATSFHFRKDHSGGGGLMLLWNDPDERPGENLAFDTAWLVKVLAMADRRVPAIRGVPVSARRCWAGLYEMTPDRHPVLGPIPGIQGLYVACGFSGHGVMHSPATGQAISEMILQGESRTFDVSSLSPDRFGRGAIFPEDGVL